MQSAKKKGREDHYFANMILSSTIQQRSYINGLQSFLGFECPQKSNCSWNQHHTIGLCNQCAELTPEDYYTNCGTPSASCSYNVPGVTQFDIESPNNESFTSLRFESKEVPTNVSIKWFDISNPILTFASIRLNPETAHFNYPPTNASICSFYPFVRMILGRSIGGKNNLDFEGSWRNKSSSAANGNFEDIPANLSDIYMIPRLEDLGIDNEHFKDAVYHIPAIVVNLMRTTLRSTLLTRVWDETNSPMHYNFSHPGFGNSQLAALRYTYAGTDYTTIFGSVSLGATYYMRQLRENKKYMVTGYINTQVTMNNVRWPWITLPAILYALTIVVFTLTVCITGGQPIWKNSLIPVAQYPAVVIALHDVEAKHLKSNLSSTNPPSSKQSQSSISHSSPVSTVPKQPPLSIPQTGVEEPGVTAP